MRLNLIFRRAEGTGRVADLVSPRVGLIVKPIVPRSLYGSYTVSYLTSSGDQFSSSTTIAEQLNTNISPGSPRAVRIALVARF